MAWQHENDCPEAWLWQHAKRLGLSRRRLVQLLVAGGAAATWGTGHAVDTGCHWRGGVDGRPTT